MDDTAVHLNVWGGLVIGAILGLVAQRSRFCVRAALVDLFEGRDRSHLRAYLMAIGVAVAATQALAGSGLVDLGETIYTRTTLPLLGLIAGALVFGAGMVLAGGCPNRLMVRAAEGQGGAMLTWLAFALTVMASFEGVLAGVRGLAASARAELPFNTLGALMGDVPAWLPPAIPLAATAVYLASAPRPSEWWHWKWPATGAVIGGLVAASWYVSTAGSDPFEPTRPLSLAFVAPAQDFLRFVTMTRLGFEAKFTTATVGGVFLGALVSSLVARDFRWSTPSGPRMLRNAVGGVLMGWGGILAMGCTIGQGIAGVSTLSLTSMLALACFVAGAWVAHRALAWAVRQEPDPGADRQSRTRDPRPGISSSNRGTRP